MRRMTPCLVAPLALLLVAGCGAEVDETREAQTDDLRADPSELAIRIDATAALAVTDSPRIQLTFTNTSRAPMKVLSWSLPSDSFWEDAFTVTIDGAKARYIGRIYKRAEPREKDFVVLAPGESRTGSIDLARLYELPKTGRYAIQLDADPSTFRGKPSAATPARRLVSNRVELTAVGRERPLREDDIRPAYYGVSYSACSDAQQDDLRIGMDQADAYAADATTYLAGPADGRARYKRWFGAYTASRYSTVKRAFDTLKRRLDTKRVTLHCDCQDDYYAYVYPDQPYDIYVCNVYWDASLDDKGGTFIHEMTHFTAVAGTADVTYGDASCRDLARSDPASAIQNADSYAYFVELP